MLFSGTSNSALATRIASLAKIPLGKTEISTFANDEKRIWIQDNVVGKHVFILQSFSAPVDEHILEYLFLVDALDRAGARSITAIVPWMGYSLQDKVFRPGETIAARVIADLISAQHIKRVMLMDLHSNSVAGFLSVPTTVLSAWSVFIAHAKKTYKKDIVVISPDFGGLKRASVFATALDVPFLNIDKRRDLTTGNIEARLASGDVRGKTCIVIDDVINTGSTMIESARVLKEHGAKRVVFYATHALLAGDASRNLEQSQVDEVIVSDTVSVEEKTFSKLRVLSVAPVFAAAMKAL
ncbi:MAG: hypothetical protein A2804_00705 [Candidatus Pacebacteria bacterium RIFCSPHIGHO2_01_FULL_46_10]|nr:MAG: hypothetical protein A2804_00705 [Candidatus Pacebacteria bacterium RIFCSPHIGHO2_01_FULL_46_10]